MDEYLGMIKIFAGNFAPRGWAFCSGQILSIHQNTALFSLLGTTYGGNGQTTFALPDLRGRAPIAFGQGPGLSSYALGETGGPASAENQQLSAKRALANCSRTPLPCASATASGTRSTPVTCQAGRSQAKARAMAPVPVPRSRTAGAAPATMRALTRSTISSVSGRGISTAGETPKRRP